MFGVFAGSAKQTVIVCYYACSLFQHTKCFIHEKKTTQGSVLNTCSSNFFVYAFGLSGYLPRKFHLIKLNKNIITLGKVKD